MSPKNHFDAAYYKRYYVTAATAVVDAAMKRNEVAFVLSFCRHIDVDIRRFADVGAGTGWWAKEFSKQCRTNPAIETFDSSVTACELYGHERSTVQRIRGRPADLVVCRDVLRYVSDTEIPKAIVALAAKCRGVLYLHVITSDDDIDREASDMSGYFRTAASYRRRLKAAGFRDCGMGLFVSSRLRSFAPFTIELPR